MSEPEGSDTPTEEERMQFYADLDARAIWIEEHPEEAQADFDRRYRQRVQEDRLERRRLKAVLGRREFTRRYKRLPPRFSFEDNAPQRDNPAQPEKGNTMEARPRGPESDPSALGGNATAGPNGSTTIRISGDDPVDDLQTLIVSYPDAPGIRHQLDMVGIPVAIHVFFTFQTDEDGLRAREHLANLPSLPSNPDWRPRGELS